MISFCKSGPAAILLATLHIASAPGAARYEVAYATLFGGSNWDQACQVIVYPDGSVLAGGMTGSKDLPTSPGVLRPRRPGDDPASEHGGIHGGDCFLVRVSPDGRRFLSSVFVGGSLPETGIYGMVPDSKGNIVIACATHSPDLLPTEDASKHRYSNRAVDWFAAKVSPDLRRLIWMTYVGGPGDGIARGGLAIDRDDFVYVAGGLGSGNLPASSTARHGPLGGETDAAVVKLKPDGSEVVFAALIGGSGTEVVMGVQVDSVGAVHIAGHTWSPDFPVTADAPQTKLAGKADCYLAKLSPDGKRLTRSTFLGGKENEFAQYRPYLEPDGSVLLTGSTGSPDFPVTAAAARRSVGGIYDGFVTRFSPDGKRLGFSTLLGGGHTDYFLMPTLDRQGNIFVVGATGSRDFPVTEDAVQAQLAGATGQWDGDGALAVLSPDGARVTYATYFGGQRADLVRSVAFGLDGEVYLVGNTESPDFPVTPGAAQTRPGGGVDAFIVKLVPVDTPKR